MKLKPIIATSALACGILTSARADYQFLGTATNAWVAYNSGVLPLLNTATPGSITTSGTGFTYRYARTSEAAGAFNTAAGSLHVPGDVFGMNFNGSVGSGVDFRMEFTSDNRHNGISLDINNGAAAGNDVISVTGLFNGKAPVNLFSGTINGGVIANVSYNIQPGGTTASVLGTVSDGSGTLWSSSTTPVTISLAADTNPLRAGFNLTAGAVTGITDLRYSYTAVPEPQTWALLSIALIGFGLWRRQAGLRG